MPHGDTALRPEFGGIRPGMPRDRVPSPVTTSCPVVRKEVPRAASVDLLLTELVRPVITLEQGVGPLVRFVGLL